MPATIEHVADRVGEQRPDEARIHDQHGDHDDGGQAHQQHHGQTSLRGVHPHLAHDLETFANHIRKVIENFGQIAAGFALQHDRGDEEFHVHQRHALGQVHQGVAHRHAEFLLFEELAKLGGDRLGDFVGRSTPARW